MGPSGSTLNPHNAGPLPYQQPMQMYQQSQYIDAAAHTTGLSYSNLSSTAVPTQETRYQSHTAFSASPNISIPSPAANEGWRSDLAAAGLTEALGDLKISHDAVGRRDSSLFSKNWLTNSSTLYQERERPLERRPSCRRV